MLTVRLLLLAVCASASTACASAQGTFVRSPAQQDPSPRGAVAHSTLGAAIEVSEALPPAPVAPQTPLAQVIALYEEGEPPTSSPVITALYQKVCADPDRRRARHGAYDAGDEIARRQDCYCAEEMPCSANSDCTDLVVCHPQLAMCDAEDAQSSRL